MWVFKTHVNMEMYVRLFRNYFSTEPHKYFFSRPTNPNKDDHMLIYLPIICVNNSNYSKWNYCNYMTILTFITYSGNARTRHFYRNKPIP